MAAGTLPSGGGAIAVVAGRIEAVIRPGAGAADETAERDRARLDKELAEAERMLAGAQARLADASFLAKAPPPVVAGAQARADELAERVARLRTLRAALG
ncbi:MAG: hypothetical protein ACKOTZ_09265 [Chloroflexota bacterium]